MKKTAIIISVLALSLMAGCNGQTGADKLISVDFNKDQVMRYKFVSSRDIDINWDPAKAEAKLTKNKTTNYKESMEMVVAYNPVEIDEYGITTLKATCESVKFQRTSSKSKRKDAVQHLPGKSFTLKVSPTGSIEDYSDLNRLVKELGEKAFRAGRKQGRIKEPDMIADFWASQWFLWDATAAIPNPSEGVEPGQTWTSKLSVPTPMVSRKARDVTYTLSEIRESDKGRIAVINSTYALAESVPMGWAESRPNGWPVAYGGRFQMAGTFGFLRGYKVLKLSGAGEELFNIDAGKTQQCIQDYQVTISAVFPASISASPQIDITQKLTMELLED